MTTLVIKYILTLENVAPWFFNRKQEFFLKSIHCKSADIFPVQKLQIELIDSTNSTTAVGNYCMYKDFCC